MRARMSLFISGVTCELREVVLRDKPAEMLELSPKATVPVLQIDQGSMLEESLEIMHWALSQHDPKGWLCADPTDMTRLIDQNDKLFKGHLDRYKYANRYENADPMAEREQAEKILAQLDQRISHTGYLCGDQASLADYAIFPFIRQFCFVDKDWFQSSAYQALNQWLEFFLNDDLFLSVMKKYKQWQAGDEVVLFGSTIE